MRSRVNAKMENALMDQTPLLHLPQPLPLQLSNHQINCVSLWTASQQGRNNIAVKRAKLAGQEKILADTWSKTN